MIECKAGETVYPAMAKSLISLSRSVDSKASRAVVVHGSSDAGYSTRAIAPGAEAMDVPALLQVLGGSNRRKRHRR